jgi:hypothetical protein
MFSGVLRWIKCRLRLCSLIPSYDDSGVFWRCPGCGKIAR